MLVPYYCSLTLLFSLASAVNEESAKNGVPKLLKRIVNAPPRPSNADHRRQTIKPYWDQNHWRNVRDQILRGSDNGATNPTHFGQYFHSPNEMIELSDIPSRNLALLNDRFPALPSYDSGVDPELLKLLEKVSQAQKQYGHHQYAVKTPPQAPKQSNTRFSNVALHSNDAPTRQVDDQKLWHSGAATTKFCFRRTGDTMILSGLFDEGHQVRYFFDSGCQGIVGQPTHCSEIILAISDCRNENNIILLEIPWIADPHTRAKLAQFLGSQLKSIGAEHRWPHFDGIFFRSKGVAKDKLSELITAFLDLDRMPYYAGLLETIDIPRQHSGVDEAFTPITYFALLQREQSEKWFKSLSDFDSIETLKIKADLLIPNGGIASWDNRLGYEAAKTRTGRRGTPNQEVRHKIALGTDDPFRPESPKEIIDVDKTKIEANGGSRDIEKAAAATNEIEGPQKVTLKESGEESPKGMESNYKKGQRESADKESAETRVDILLLKNKYGVKEPGEAEVVGTRTSGPIANDNGKDKSSSLVGIFTTSAAEEMLQPNATNESKLQNDYSILKHPLASEVAPARVSQTKSTELSCHVAPTLEHKTLPSARPFNVPSKILATNTYLFGELNYGVYNRLISTNQSANVRHRNPTLVTTTVTKCNNAGYCIDTTNGVNVSFELCTALGPCKSSATMSKSPPNLDDENDYVEFDDNRSISPVTEPLVLPKEPFQRGGENKPDKTAGNMVSLGEFARRKPNDTEMSDPKSPSSDSISHLPTSEDKYRKPTPQPNTPASAKSFPRAENTYASSALAGSPLIDFQELSNACGKPVWYCPLMMISAAFMMAAV